MTLQLAGLRVESEVSREERAPSKRYLRNRFYLALVATDALALALGFALANIIRFGDVANPQGWRVLAVLLPLFWVLVLNSRAFSADVLAEWRSGIVTVVGSLQAAIIMLMFVAFLLKASMDISRIMVALGIVCSTILLVLGRWQIGRKANAVFAGAPMSRVLITDGADCPSPPDVHRIAADRLGLTLEEVNPFTLDRLGRYLDGADIVIVSCAPEKRAAWAKVLKGANIHGELTLPELDEMGGIGATRFAGTATMLVASGPLATRDQIAKRALDLAVATSATLFLAPLLLLVALAIRLDSRGPVLFVQQRVGRGNKLFPVLKFRSMYTDSCDTEGARSTAVGDDRITRVGRFIRATSIDELPQLINVLRGEMSLVGPRPHALGSLAGDELFWEVDSTYWHRHACKPGLTGLAQVRGFRGATRNREDLINRLRADLEYLNGWNVGRDISILLATVKVVVHPNAF